MLLTLLAPDLAGSPVVGAAGILAALGIGVVLVVLLHRRQPG